MHALLQKTKETVLKTVSFSYISLSDQNEAGIFPALVQRKKTVYTRSAERTVTIEIAAT